MQTCPFCKSIEEQCYPLCQHCGSLHYPVDTDTNDRKQKLKLYAAVAAMVITPGSFAILIAVGAKQLKQHIKNKTKK